MTRQVLLEDDPMATQLPDAAQQFAKKLEAFSQTLSDQEKRAFVHILNGGALSDKQLDQATGGAIGAGSLSRFNAFSVATLNRDVFSRYMLSW
jgi:hypothetical protein